MRDLDVIAKGSFNEVNHLRKYGNVDPEALPELMVSLNQSVKDLREKGRSAFIKEYPAWCFYAEVLHISADSGLPVEEALPKVVKALAMQAHELETFIASLAKGQFKKKKKKKRDAKLKRILKMCERLGEKAELLIYPSRIRFERYKQKYYA